MNDRETGPQDITRRQALRELGTAGAGIGLLGGGLDALLASTAAAKPRAGSLKDIDHVVILIQENRSFDHYFGTLSGVRGFDDHRGRSAFTQVDASHRKFHPFRLESGCFSDITHDWAPQHQAWNGGRMDQWMRAHEAADGAAAAETMGYYNGTDLPFYHALANAFTICDGYHCSVIGPTDPNRLMSVSATIDPAGKHGGPLLKTNIGGRTGRFSWTTMPERLQAHGVDWKVYTSPSGGVLDNVLTYFKQYTPGSKLAQRGLEPTYPADFLSDLAGNRLPKVSWVLAGLGQTEHPSFSSPVAGESAARQVVEALVSHPKTWARTALFITWDENGGFFDHVAPPTPPHGTKGEFLTTATLPPEAGGIRGPIGLGFRVPMLVVSPFTRGGLVCSDVFDHTSTLRFLETRFGVEVPNLSAWRRKHTGDLTSAFNFAATPRTSRPSLPAVADANGCTTAPPAPYVAQSFPRQERKPRRRRPSGIVKRA
jgi:phospholipase C